MGAADRQFMDTFNNIARAFARTQMAGRLTGEDYKVLVAAYPSIAQHVTLDEVARGEVTDSRLRDALPYANGGRA